MTLTSHCDPVKSQTHVTEFWKENYVSKETALCSAKKKNRPISEVRSAGKARRTWRLKEGVYCGVSKRWQELPSTCSVTGMSVPSVSWNISTPFVRSWQTPP